MIEVKNNEGVKAWLNGYANSTQRLYRIGYDLFLDFMNGTVEGKWNEERLLKEREEDVRERKFAFEELVVQFYQWLKETNPKLSDNTRQSYVKSVRSFFGYHRLDLKFTNQQRAKVTKQPKPKRHYHDFSLEEIRKMIGVAKPKEKYILGVGKEIGLRASDFIRLKQKTFISALDQKIPVSLGEIHTRKEGISAYPFLGFDGKEASERWLQVLKSEGKYDPEAPMLDIKKKELTEILKRLAQRSGITLRGKIRFHSLRRFLITRLTMAHIEENRWKMLVGKKANESAYVSPLYLKEDYERVLPMITANAYSEMPHGDELRRMNERIVEVEKENVELRQDIAKLVEIVVTDQEAKARARKLIEWLAEVRSEELENKG